jgi:sugar lactone lactonase YvrE
MSTISSGTTITTSLVQTGDTTGDLVIKTGSSNATAMTISGTDQSVAVNNLSIVTPGGDASIVANNEVSSWIYSNLTKSVVADETAPSGLFFKSDGTLMYITGTTGDDVTQYTLSTAWDVSTAGTPVTFSGAAQDTAPQDLFFKPDGLTMYIVGSTNDAVYQYTLGTAWDITTASYASISFSVAAQETTPQGIWFKSDGTSMYIVGSTNDAVYQYTLGTAWDLSTASYASISFSVAAQDSGPSAINFSPDGAVMYVLGTTNDRISQYTLGTPWNVSTAVYVDAFYVGNQEQTPNGLFVSLVNDVAYVAGSSSDAVFQYDTNVNSIEFNSLNTVFPNRVTVENDLYVQDRLAVGGTFQAYGSATLASATSGTTSISGTLTASGAVTFSTTTGVITLGTAQTTGTFTVGGPTQTGAIVVGQSTGAQTLSIASGATTSGTTKTVNIGTAGVSGSTTAINIGSAVSGANSTVSINGTLNANGASLTSLNASNIDSGTVPTARLATGTANATTYLRGDQTWATVSSATANNGTLTMTTSGTGLSGSATFTADQSGNTTFTVASNATNANTVSTIVARDGSGNFSAGTITANLTGNASGSAATFTSTTQNSQFNSIGVGTAGSGTAGEIRATNNITAYFSDERLKTKIGDIENALDKVKQIETMVYHANETAVALGYDASVIEVGVTAQSVQKVQPQVVAPAPIDDKYLTVRYERLVPLLIEAIKELEAQIAELKAK